MTHYGGDSHLGNFNKMIEDLVVHPDRNRTIANILLTSFDVQFLLVTSMHRQVELIDELLLNDEKFYTMTHDDIEELISGKHNIEVRRFETRLLAISFVAFEKLIQYYMVQPPGSPNIFDGLGGFVVGTPHKNIDNIIEYAYTYHNNRAKHKFGNQLMGHSKFKYVGHDSCAVYDIADNHELLSMWATWHEDKYLRLKLMDPNPPAHHEESKHTTNIVVPRDHKAHTHYNQKYHGILNDLGSPGMKSSGDGNSPTAAENISALGTKHSPLADDRRHSVGSGSPMGGDARARSPVGGDGRRSPMGGDARARSPVGGGGRRSPMADSKDRAPRQFARAEK